ncbi:hypothetical protein Hanom_Chr17g01568971 [Helianthus anomalus]
MYIVWHEGSEKDRNRHFFGELFHGESHVHAAQAMAHQHHLLLWRNRGHEFEQWLSVVGKCGYVLYYLGIRARGGEIKGGDAVARGLQKGFELEPAPGSMACTMDQNNVLLLIICESHVTFVLVFVCCYWLSFFLGLFIRTKG